ncbi:Hypothetical protein PBC10988_21940 [Planctomycetales bacterium 10988]|nr:Hypothetical protein PBC10988_21940 [Planctomycetales bacterium 10988]
MSSLLVLGGTGFVGKYLLQNADLTSYQTIYVLTRDRHKAFSLLGSKPVKYIEAELSNISVIAKVLEEGMDIVNLLRPPSCNLSAFIKSLCSILLAANEKKARRFLHCGTAAVVGRSSQTLIDETTSCHPFTDYEKDQFAIEKRVCSLPVNHLEIVTLRPTAIFGPGGKNLLSLADRITSSSTMKQVSMRWFQQDRTMNLVPVGTVAEAISFLCKFTGNLQGEIFQISTDQEALNQYRLLEKWIVSRLNCANISNLQPQRPDWFFSLVSRGLGRSNIAPHRRYSADKLYSLGFQSKVSFEQALEEFLDWYLTTKTMAA